MSAGREAVPMPSLETAISTEMTAAEMTDLIVAYLRGDQLIRSDAEAERLLIAITRMRWLVWSEANPLGRRLAA